MVFRTYWLVLSTEILILSTEIRNYKYSNELQGIVVLIIIRKVPTRTS